MDEIANQDFIDRFNEAETLFKQNRLAESLEKYGSLLKIEPTHVSILNNMGLIYEKLGQYDKAVDSYSKCHDIKPDLVVFIHNLANAYTRLDRWSDALPLLKRIVDTDFDRENNTEKYALCLFNEKSREETAGFIKMALARYPDNQRLHRLLGRTLLHMNAHVDGLKHLRKGAGMIEFNSDGVSYLH